MLAPNPSPLPAPVVPHSPALMAAVSPGGYCQGVFIRTAGHHTHPVSIARLRSSTACFADSLPSRSSSMAAHAMQRAITLRTARAAMRWGSRSFIAGSLLDASTQTAALAGASASRGGKGWAHQKGQSFRVFHAFSFAPAQPVTQLEIPLSFFIEAPMNQLQLRLLGRLDAPSVVPPQFIGELHNYREAVRFCWMHRRRTAMTKRMLAEEAGLYAPHVTCYLADMTRQQGHYRDLPAEGIKAFQTACGNTAISQWVALQGQLTVLEEIQAARAAA